MITAYLGMHKARYVAIRDRGERVIIDGVYGNSACTVVLGIVPLQRICATPRASLGFHLAYYDTAATFGVVPELRGHRGSGSHYPETVKDWIDRNGGLTNEMKRVRAARHSGQSSIPARKNFEDQVFVCSRLLEPTYDHDQAATVGRARGGFTPTTRCGTGLNALSSARAGARRDRAPLGTLPESIQARTFRDRLRSPEVTRTSKVRPSR